MSFGLHRHVAEDEPLDWDFVNPLDEQILIWKNEGKWQPTPEQAAILRPNMIPSVRRNTA